MAPVPPSIQALFERRLSAIEKRLTELETQSAHVYYDTEGKAVLVVGNLLPITGINEVGIAYFDNEEWNLLEADEDE